jgi:hypothetical protein
MTRREGLNEGKHKRRRQGFEHGKGKSTLRGGTLREVGSANSSELEAQPNGDQKGKEKVYRRLLEMAEHGRNATNRKSGNCISERGIHERRQIASVIGTWVKVQQRIVVERGVWCPLRQRKQTDAIRPLNSRLWLSANVGMKS